MKKVYIYNQYSTKSSFPLRKVFILTSILYFLICAFLGKRPFTFDPGSAGDVFQKLEIEPVYAALPIEIEQEVILPSGTYDRDRGPSSVPTQREIEDYVRIIFGNEAAGTAIAVSKNECSPNHRDYPYCVLHTSAEYSVGVFQINLYNKDHWVHAAKVPGEKMSDKIEWLKDPYHNTLIAYKIYQESGFYPWTAYTSGNYLKDM